MISLYFYKSISIVNCSLESYFVYITCLVFEKIVFFFFNGKKRIRFTGDFYFYKLNKSVSKIYHFLNLQLNLVKLQHTKLVQNSPEDAYDVK